MVYSYVASRLTDRGAAEDVTQEVFVMGARYVARGGDMDVAWLKTVARNKLIDHWRARARQELMWYRRLKKCVCSVFPKRHRP